MRPCELEDCERPHVARGLCGTHYNQTYHPNRHKKTVEVICAYCGATVRRNYRAVRWATNFCNPEHQDAYQWAEQRASRRQVSIYTHQSVWLRVRWPEDTKGTDRTFVATNCAICGQAFLCLFGSRVCSDQCKATRDKDIKRDGKHRRRAARHSAFKENVSPSKTFARDDYECQLCGEPMDMTSSVPHPLAATIDHIIPLSRGGTHEPANVQSAHFICNAYKGDREYAFDGTPRRALAA